MENIALIESFSEFKDDKLIDRVTLMAILEDVFRNALKKKYGSDDNFDIIINPDKGDMEIWRNRVVVEDGEVEDENSEISLSDTHPSSNCANSLVKRSTFRYFLHLKTSSFGATDILISYNPSGKSILFGEYPKDLVVSTVGLSIL